MFAKSVFVVHSQVISLSDRPLSLKTREIRRAFRQLFFINCFTDLRLSFRSPRRYTFYDPNPEEDRTAPLPGKPFLRGLGQISFKTRDDEIAEYLAHRRDYWDPSARKDKEILVDPPEFFGFDPTLNDQRMYHLWFELDRPLFIRAMHNGTVQAQGHIYIHIFPSGYVSLFITAALMAPNLVSLEHVGRAVLETYPWEKQTSWVWTSRLGDGRLEEIADKVKQNLFDSIFENKARRKPAEHSWYPAIRISTDNSVDQLATGLFGGQVQKENIGVPASVFTQDFPRSRIKEFILSNQGFICRLTGDRSAITARSFFWQVMGILEFVRLKDQIYQDYADFLRPEVVRLRSYRLSPKQKMLKEDVRKLSAYDLNIPIYLLALDTYTRSLSPTSRYIYSLLSDRTGFSRRREKLKQVVKEWEAEVALWEHPLSLLWRKVLAPLRSLLRL
jgi:hypothetical protein